MSRMITVKIDSDDLIEMLCDRFDLMWSAQDRLSYDEEELWHTLFEIIVAHGAFDKNNFSVSEIVDNAYVNEYRCLTRDACIDEYGFDPVFDDSRVIIHDDDLYIISRR